MKDYLVVDKIMVAAMERTIDALDNGLCDMPPEFEREWGVLSSMFESGAIGEGDDIADFAGWLVRECDDDPDTAFSEFICALGIEYQSADWYDVFGRYCVRRASKMRGPRH